MITATVGSSSLQAANAVASRTRAIARVSARRSVELCIGLLLAALPKALVNRSSSEVLRMPNVRRSMMTAQRPWIKLMAVLWGLTACGTLLAQAPATARRAHVEIRTELGTMVVALYNETPVHRDSFLALVKAAAYDSLLFHTVVPGFTVQGGEPLNQRMGATLPAEIVPGLI